jgi:adsorption protein B
LHLRGGGQLMASMYAAMDTLLQELLLFCGFWFLIGAIDDFCIDVIWIIRRVYRKLRYYRHVSPMTVEQLPAPNNPGRLAVFIPTWQESAIIEKTLRRCLAAWGDHANYVIYVGCYPNDYDGINAIRKFADNSAAVRLIICDMPGPTTKADCLNQIWRAMVYDELSGGMKMKAVILHDAEDLVHADELKIYDALIEKNDAVQIPVIPVRVAGSRWISGHYCDEFAESHGKSMVVREALGAPLPLAGVGCAIERNLLGRIALQKSQHPFDAASLTEDYELGLKIGRLGGKTILARISNADGDLIGTRACFPATLETSVRQKTRWLTGIALAGWDRLGWQGGAVQFWMLCRDRKAIFAALVLTLAYAAFSVTAILAVLHVAGLHRFPILSDNIFALVLANGLFLFWRMSMRALFVWKIYGPAEAALSVPRVIISNIVAIMAARRAVSAYLRHCFGADLKWDKTAHLHFPPEQGQD